MVEYINHPLDPGFARVRRANEHLADLDDRIGDVFRQQENTVVVEFDLYPPHGIKIHPPTETFFGLRIPILIGEACYNLRCALDYLVFELAELDSGVEQSGTKFPIVDAKEDFIRDAERRWLKGLNPAHVAAIERLQPYNGHDWPRRLREYSNPDKHKHLLSGNGKWIANAYSSIDSDLSRISGAARKAMHPVRGEVDMKLHYTGTVSFADDAPVIETLEEISAKVSDTLSAFKPEFERKGTP
jgi:hypothetical protein